MMKILLAALLFLFALTASMHLEEDDLEEDGREAVEPEYLDLLLKEERYEEFNRLVGIDIPDLSRPRSEKATGDPRFNHLLEHGDIVLTPKQKELARQSIRYDKYPSYKWPNGKVPYFISSNFTSAEKQKITEWILSFNADFGGCVEWKPRVAETDYVHIINGSGCFSNLGRIRNQQTLSLARYGCLYKGTCLHEMLHAMGTLHEQCRPDRDDYIIVRMENIKPDWQSQYRKESSDSYGIYGPYDCYSIMHYPQKHPDVSNNLPAFDVKDSSIDVKRIGSAQNFTATDISKLKKAYCG